MPPELVVAVVEDTPSAYEPLIEAIHQAGSYRVEQTDNFDTAIALVAPSSDADVLVLDWYADSLPDEAESAGRKVWNEVWKRRLIPVVIWSAYEFSATDDFPTNNPLFKFIRKGSGSEDEVVAFLEEVKPFVEAMRIVQSDLDTSVRSVLLETAPLVWPLTEGNPAIRSEVLRRSSRRRLAASLDIAADGSNEKLAHWEHYVLPPMGASLMMGDILRDTPLSPADPSAFRVVLTPSCDLQLNQGKCKVAAVLVARCKNVEQFLSLVGGKGDILRERLPRQLSEPHHAGLVALPAFAGTIPNMAADLRDLELVSIADVYAEKGKAARYVRVASIDSPFREYLSWAYLQIAGRPGLPERDFAPWVKELVPDNK